MFRISRFVFGIFTFVILSFVLVSCEEEIVTREDGQGYNEANEPLYNLLKEWYLWYDKMPEVDPKNYDTPQDLLNAVRYEKDVWSYVTTQEEFEQYYQEGKYIGYGFGHKWDADGRLRIIFVYEDSPLSVRNIERGWIIDEINGTKIDTTVNISELMGDNALGVQNDFQLISPTNDTMNATFSKEEITVNTILHSSVVEHNGNKTGYIVLKSFIEKTEDELYQAFQELSSQNISNVVIDLRYNGGGMLSMAREAANYVIPDNFNGQLFTKLVLNDKKQEQNTYHYFRQDSLSLGFNLSNIYFISTRSTASASEALINGLKPYMNVYNIGQQTYGKPVGMYAFYDNQGKYAFLPVCFKVSNANNVADYYDGLPVDVESTDDIAVPFGQPGEDCLAQALYHIENGAFNMKKTVRRSEHNKVQYNSLRDLIGAW